MRVLAIAAGIAALIIVVVVAFIATRRDHPSIDRELAARIRSSIPTFPAARERDFAAKALAELEERRLPAPMLMALKEAAIGGPLATVSLAESFNKPEVRPLWRRTCPQGTRVLVDGIRRGSGRVVCEGCAAACSRLGGNLDGPPAHVAFAMLSADVLSQHGSLDSVEVELLQILAH